jgi:transposase
MICTGIDWADDKHDVCIRDAEDRRILAEFIITHDDAGVRQLEGKMTAFGYEPADCPVAIETPHGLLVGYLLQRGYPVYPIPPKAVTRYRDRHKMSGAKSDTSDALILADILCVDREMHRPMPADSPLAQEIRELSRQRQALVREKTRLKNQLTACLKAYYPVALALFSDLDCNIARTFLRAYPSLEAARKTSLEELKGFFASRSYPGMRRVPEIYQKLQAPVIPVVDWQVRVQQRHMLALVDLLEALVPQIKAYERELSRLLDEHPDALIFRSLPGAGEVIAAWLLGEIGDCRDKFETASAMQALAGTCPVTVGSNKRVRVKFRVACCKSFRNAMQQFARQSSLPGQSAWARGYFHDQLARGHSISRATRALANRWLSIIFRIWQDGVEYDERVHLRNRANHGWQLAC